MSDKKSIEDVAMVVGNEGLGYAVADYMGAKSIEDEELAKLWEVASKALDDIENFFSSALGRDWRDKYMY